VTETDRSIEFELTPADNTRLANLCGEFDRHLKEMESRLGVAIHNRGGLFRIEGDQATEAAEVLRGLYAQADEPLEPETVHLALTACAMEEGGKVPTEVRTRRLRVHARGARQGAYIRAIRGHDLVFGVGPAGTGKTFLAVACAVEALEDGRVERLVLVRPAVEAGERLGFLPGDLAQKVDPYLRPIYDALYEMLGFDAVTRLIERSVIEVAPLAFMRGRSLNEAFIILDEAQNATEEQMKMFLTRIGFGATAVVTGDLTQTDLPRGKASGLHHSLEVLAGIEGIATVRFDSVDVVRHPLVQRIVAAYDARGASTADDG
jgi:phosphate starvation-inducible protein PhoH and related proteins